MAWTVMEWLEAGGYVVAIVGGIAGACVFVGKQLRKHAKFVYPPTGEEGPNILSPETSTVAVGDTLSMSAIVPDDAELLLKLIGEPVPPDVADQAQMGLGPRATWAYTVAPAPLNWRGRRYQPGSETVPPTQNFVARSGPAELAINFRIPGRVVIAAYERGANSPTWSKTLQVLPFTP